MTVGPAVRVVLLCIAAVCATGCAGVRADDGLERVHVDADRQTNRIIAVPGGRWVVVDTAGPLPRLLAWDGSLHFVAQAAIGSGVGVSTAGDRLVRMGSGELEILELPTFRQTANVTFPPHFVPLSILEILGRPGGGGWASVSRRDGILRIDDVPPRTGPVGKPALRKPVGAAIDDATGLLVLVGDGNRAEGFDLDKMETRFVVDLPTTKLSYDVASLAGRAWIGTKDGSGRVIELDLTSGLPTMKYDLGLAGDVYLAASRAGQVVVAVSERFVSADEHPAVLKVFRVTAGGLVEDASLTAVLPCVTNDVAIVAEWGVVLLAGRETLAWRYRGSAPGR